MIESPKVIVKNLKTPSSVHCQERKGRLFVKSSQERQKAAFKTFGLIPNDCVDEANGKVRCHFKK